MSTALQERPPDLRARGDEGGGPARRAIVRWAWRLFRREWHQQVLVLALVTLAVAATTVGVALASNAETSSDAMFGTANSFLNVPGSDHADIAAARRAFGTIEEIDDRAVPIPGSLDTVDLRAQATNGRYSKPMLRLVAGHSPTGPDDVAMTAGVAAIFDLHLGDVWHENGRDRNVVGLVENPVRLDDEFALVAPGQISPPDQATILFDATSARLDAFQTVGQGAVGIGHRVPLDKTDAAAVILALETIGLLFVGLVAAAGFAVMAQRRLRALGMLGALGATDRQVRLAMVANGAVVGAVGAVGGVAVGLVGWIALAPHVQKLAKHRVDVLNLPWWALAAAMVLAVVTAIAAAWWPARAAARASIVTALSGRPALPKPAHRFATLGGVLLAAGIGCLAFAHRSVPNASLIIAGTIATTFGMLFLGPLGIRALAAGGRRAPIAIRLALRDLARYQARSAAALGAISLALAIAATVAVSAAALAGPQATANLAANEAIISLAPSNDFVIVDGAAALPEVTPDNLRALTARVDALAASLHARAVIPLDQAVDPGAATVSPGPNGASGTSANDVVPAILGKRVTVAHQGKTGTLLVDVVPLYVATPALLRYSGINAHDVDPSADILTSRTGLRGLKVTEINPLASGPDPCPGATACGVPRAKGQPPTQWAPIIQNVKLPRETSEPNALLTTHALRAFGLRSVAAGWLIQTHDPLTTAQIDAARRTAGAAGITIETRTATASYTRLRNGATAIGLLVALGVLAMTVGLIRSETANDLRTLTATGATSTTRRTLTAATAGALALLGALLGTGGAYLALIAWHRSDLRPLTHVPFVDLAVIIVGLPLTAITGGWLLAGREPPTITHQPLE